MSTIFYTYVVGWTKLNKFYYGVRFAKNCHPNDLWKKYFTSSKIVKHYRETHGEPDIVQVRKIFNDVDNAILWERKVLTKLKVLTSDKWLNQNIGGAVKLDEETYKIIAAKNSVSNKEYVMKNLSPEERQEKSSTAAVALWKKFKDDPVFAENLREKRRNQVNPMQGRKQKRICCVFCNKDIPVNLLYLHKNCK